MDRLRTAACTLAVCGLVYGSALAADPLDSDWPCIQRKVPVLSAGMMWAGPEVDEADRSWQDAQSLVDLAHGLSQRRMSMAQAMEEIDRFALGLQGGKDAQLTLLFAGLLQFVNAERNDIIAGIERYARRQVALADKVRSMTGALNELRAKSSRTEAENAEVATLEERLLWDTRVFDERERSLTYVCEVPVLLEQRLFALARHIMTHLE